MDAIDCARKRLGGWAHKGGDAAIDGQFVELVAEFQLWTNTGPDTEGIPALMVDGCPGPETIGAMDITRRRAAAGNGGTLDQNWGAVWADLIAFPGEHNQRAPRSSGAGGGATTNPAPPPPAPSAPKSKKSGGLWGWALLGLGTLGLGVALSGGKK